MRYIYTMKYYSAIKRKISTCDNWINLDGAMLSEMSGQKRQIPHNLTYICNYKSKTNQKTK